MSIPIHQALFGYQKGHRLVASSKPIESGRSGRILRSVTDMAFDGEAGTYITVLPLPELLCHAVCRSWPDDESERPGSVWTHVLFINFADLGSISDLSSLQSLFRRPERKMASSKYEDFRTELFAPASVARTGRIESFDTEDLESLLWPVYGKSKSQILAVDKTERFEDILFGMWSQQWPRLRRSFSFRTRFRVGGKSLEFDLEVVERLQRGQVSISVPDQWEAAPWVATVARDLAAPDQRLRDFLQRFGVESERGRGDFLPLIQTFDSLVNKRDLAKLARVVSSDFPTSKDMPGLKLELFGPSDSTKRSWGLSELDRLTCILDLPNGQCVDLDQMEFEDRLSELWKNDRSHAVDLTLLTATRSFPNRDALSLMIAKFVASALPGDVLVLSETQPEFAVGLLRSRPELLRHSSIWRDPGFREMLASVTMEQPREAQLEVLEALLKSRSWDASTAVVRQSPELWWEALRYQSQFIRDGNKALRATAVITELLGSVGPASVGKPHYSLKPNARLTLAFAAPPQTGLWMQVRPQEWLEVSKQMLSASHEMHFGRALAVILGSAISAEDTSTSKKLWQACFGPIATCFVDGQLSEEVRAALDGWLPSGDGDIGERLCLALSLEVHRSNWSTAEKDRMVREAGPLGPELRRLFPKQKKGIVKNLRDFVGI